jgi:hypothetical protein
MPSRDERRKPLQEAYRLAQKTKCSIEQEQAKSEVSTMAPEAPQEPAVPIRPRPSNFISHWSLAFWHWMGKRWRWEVIFSLGWLGMLKIGEYGIALGLLALSGLAAVSKIAHWEGIATLAGLTKLIRLSGYVTVLFVFLILLIVTVDTKGLAKWSHVPAAVENFVALIEGRPRPINEPSQGLYDFTGTRGRKLLGLLKVKPELRQPLKIGCAQWSESACVAAGKFLLIASEAGWKIDSDRVFRVNSTIPNDGITLVTYTVSTEKLAPHEGVWKMMDDSDKVIWNALTQMGIMPRSASQHDFPRDTLGLNFGPEPVTGASRP